MGRLSSLAKRAAIRTCLLLVAFLAGLTASTEAAGIRGLPFSRIYSLEDIGYVPRGSRLGFDAFGRIAIIHDGVYAVLNDTIWLNIADATEDTRVPITNLVHGQDGRGYYVGLGSWGRAEIRSDGKLHAVSLVPEAPPAWTRSTTFEDVLITDEGVYFASRGGVVYLNVAEGKPQLFELPRSAKTFQVSNQVFVSRFDQPLQHLDVANRTIRDIPSALPYGTADHVVERATQLDDGRALVSLLDGRMFVFDGKQAVPWAGQSRANLTGRISALQRLPDGNVAVGITEQGIFVLSPDGQLLSSLTIPQYHRISDIASREPGVMWVLNEDSIEKILYGSGLTGFSQRLGLALEWPLVVSWNGQTLVSSGGVLYEAVEPVANGAARFERLKVQPASGAWSLAAWGRRMLVGNPSALYSYTTDGRFEPLPHVRDMSHLAMVKEGLCYAVGRTEIAVFSWDGEKWFEPAPRIAGVRNPSVVHAAGGSVWIETGGDGVARVTLEDGRLHLMSVPNEPWTRSLWVNVGVVGDTVVLAGARGDRRFFSEETGSWCERPDLDQLLNRSTEWLARVRRDPDGNLWATHNEGVIKFTPRDGDYEMDALTFDLINDRYPTVQVLPDNEVWISASRSLYHVERSVTSGVQPFPKPVLVSLMDVRRNTELMTLRSGLPSPLRFAYDQNNLTFRFFSGGYAWRRTPEYEFRLNLNEPWSTPDTGSLLRFPGLHEGHYRLQVRLAGPSRAPGAPLTLPFEIMPPWHRTQWAYALYVLLAVLASSGALRWSGHLTRKRNRDLEQLVRDRTGELESTMSKLNEETRITATLAERNRLAGEIHDSVQQGLSGAILQLDTTLTLPALTGNLRNRLNVVRNMVSYARQEVQHAVWDIESPLLEGNDLGEALHKLSTFVTVGKLTPKIQVSGSPVTLPRATMHNLLRIAQEATTNALRHAGASEISIKLDYQQDAVALTISDNGAGFQPEAVLIQTGHFGLRGIRTRAKKLRGSLTITSAPSEGTLIHVTVPLAVPVTV